MKLSEIITVADNPIPYTHVAYSDEAYHTEGRFRSISVVSLVASDTSSFEKEIRALLTHSELSGEFKWKDVNSAKRRFAAIKLINWVVEKVIRKSLRVDVLIWDTDDKRHKVKGRDDSENLKRMYHHIYKNILIHRWPDNAVWALFPDENSIIDWDKQRQILDYTSAPIVLNKADLFQGERVEDTAKYEVHHISEVQSHHSPLCQVADLFAGMASFSRSKFDDYKNWTLSISAQLSLFLSSENKKFSTSDIERFQVLSSFDKLSRKMKRKPSFQSSRGLRTYDPKIPINFWWYEPQHEFDKAPLKGPFL